MSTKRKRFVLSIKDKQAIIQRLDQGAKGTNLSLEYDIQQTADFALNTCN